MLVIKILVDNSNNSDIDNADEGMEDNTLLSVYSVRLFALLD